MPRKALKPCKHPGCPRLTADAEVVLVVCSERALGVGQREVAQVGRSEHLYASLYCRLHIYHCGNRCR